MGRPADEGVGVAGQGVVDVVTDQLAGGRGHDRVQDGADHLTVGGA